MRQLYLGTDEAEARKIAADDGTILRTGRTRGAAMKAAAMAHREERERRFGPR